MGERCLYIETNSTVRRYVLGKNIKPLVIVQNRLFRCDNDLMVRCRTGGDEFVSYMIEHTQPRGTGKYVDTRHTMAYIRIAQSCNRSGSVSVLGTLNQISITKLMYILVAGVVIFSVLSGGI